MRCCWSPWAVEGYLKQAHKGATPSTTAAATVPAPESVLPHFYQGSAEVSSKTQVYPSSTCSLASVRWARQGAAKSRWRKRKPVHCCCCPLLNLAHCMVTACGWNRAQVALGLPWVWFRHRQWQWQDPPKYAPAPFRKSGMCIWKTKRQMEEPSMELESDKKSLLKNTCCFCTIFMTIKEEIFLQGWMQEVSRIFNSYIAGLFFLILQLLKSRVKDASWSFFKPQDTVKFLFL